MHTFHCFSFLRVQRMASRNTDDHPPLCGQCPNRDSSMAPEMYCVDCKIHLCNTCLSSHKVIPDSKFHSYRSTTAQLSLEREINNKNLKKKDQKLLDVSKIGMSIGPLEKAVLGFNINKPWMVRDMKCSFSEAMNKVKFVKVIENLSNDPYRLGVVNDNLWIRDTEGSAHLNRIAVYDQDLNLLKRYSWPEVTYISTAQQISDNDVIILTGAGLHVVDTEGKYQYKIMEGNFSDVSVHENQVAVVEYKENKLVFLHKKQTQWEVQDQTEFHDPDENTKTIQLDSNNMVFIGVLWSDRIIKVDRSSGEITHQYGSGEASDSLGKFNKPCINGLDGLDCLVVSDTLNNRFQMVDSQDRFEEVRIQGLTGIRDVLVLGGNKVYVLHRVKHGNDQVNCKISAFTVI